MIIFIRPGDITGIHMVTGTVPEGVFATLEEKAIIQKVDQAVQIFVNQKLFLQSNS
jgi:hypothetical protein